MPMTITLLSCGIWFCVGFFTALGWTLGSVLMGKLCSAVFH